MIKSTNMTTDECFFYD